MPSNLSLDGIFKTLCAICGKPIEFVEQSVAVKDADGRQVHWKCWRESEGGAVKGNV